MLLTEQEAKTKECCGPQASHPYRASPNCSGSACMAWRWRHSPEYTKATGTDANGYCGLAGRIA